MLMAATAFAAAAPLDTMHRNGFEACSLAAERIVFPGSHGDGLEGWLWRSRCAQPTAAPAVVMLHGCSGVYAINGYGPASNVSSRFVRRALDLNDQGIHALLVDSFSTRDPDDPPATSRQDYCNARAAIVAIGATEEYDRPRDATGGYSKLLTLTGESGQPLVDPDRVGLIGWSHGGSAALATVARNHLPSQPFQTAQVFYPGCGLYGAFGNPGNGTSTYVADVPTQLHIGTADTISDIPTCTAHREHSDAAQGADMSITPWQDAMHSFDGANCVRNDQGGLVSPWTGLRWSCAGTYDGVPFSLYDWFARINSAESMRCAFAIHLKGQDPSGCPSVLLYP
jgi:dienelactone hydrolase